MAVRQMARLNGIDNALKRDIAIDRRENQRRPPQDIHDHTRICAPCNISIVREIREMENDPHCLKMNVLTQASSHLCLICDEAYDIIRLPLHSRVDVFLRMHVYVRNGTRCCPHHLDENGLMLEVFLNGIRFINRPCKIQGTELLEFLNALRGKIIEERQRKFEDETDFRDDHFHAISPISKQQFNDLYSFCDPVHVDLNGSLRHISKKDLLAFLCKMRQGLSDEIVSAIFNYSTRQAASLAISLVRRSLMERFVPQNIGFTAIPREEYIERHVTPFANVLYNPDPNIRRAIVCDDCTYLDIEKSTNFRVLRQSYCIHKGKHLIKPSIFVAPDGYILNILGPYFSNTANNDANILVSEFERDIEGIRNWFQMGDIYLVDRGYRDAVPTLEALGINVQMPSLLQPGQTQLTTEEANHSKIVSKLRWVNEARNGHLKLIFKFMKNCIAYSHIPNVQDFLLICGGIINKYHPPIIMQNATEEYAREMMNRAREPNVVQARVDVDRLRFRRGQWAILTENDILRFPRMTLDQLKDLTYGTFQIQLSASYIQDNSAVDRQAEFQLDHLHEPGFMRVRFYSRYRNATRYQLWIAFTEIDDSGLAEEGDEYPIQGYYCTCPTGARTLGTCVHVAAVIWYFSYARHQDDLKYPPTRLLNVIINVLAGVEENLEVADNN